MKNSSWDFDLGAIESGSSGFDALFESEPSIVTPVEKTASLPVPPPLARVKVSSLQQLAGFDRVSNETLIHKSTQDLWTISRQGEEYFIERLCQDGSPLKV